MKSKTVPVIQETVGDSQLYVLQNDLHRRPFGLMLRPEPEDSWMGVKQAFKHDCYKFISFEDKSHYLPRHGQGLSLELSEGKPATQGLRYSNKQGRAYLYVLEDLAFMEDVFVQPKYRGQGVGTEIVQHLITESERLGASSLFCGVRLTKPETRDWYRRFGFENQGYEYRITYS